MRPLLSTLILTLATSTTIVLADVRVTSPTPGQIIAGGTQGAAITVNWVDSGVAPSLAELEGSYSIYLWAGGNTDQTSQQVGVIVENKAMAGGGNTAQGVVPLGAGGSVTNAYFLKIISNGRAGQVINTSPRFSLTGMTGTFPPAILAAARAVTTTDGPPRVFNAAAQAPGAAGPEQFDVPFAEQTGFMRYAPMMKVPPTKITKTDLRPLYPTSQVVIATTFLPVPEITQTVTRQQTFSVSSRENSAAPVANPTDDLQRFLNRWKD